MAGSSESPAAVRLRGARERNLRGVDLDLPLDRWTAVTGVSGSGKTSLVFDTLVREGQRRYLSGLSPRARQFFGKLGHARVDSLERLPVAVAVGQHALGASVRSTVGTLVGALDLLRLLFARVAEDPGGVALTRSHFSFNHPLGACEACDGLGLEERVDPALLVADESKSLRAGALVPTLKNGYTVYSQVTLEVMDTICRAHGFDVHTPWRDLTQEQRDVVLHGSTKLKVPFGKHSIESRMKWEGITARPREEGYYKGLVPVITETLGRNRNPNVLRFVRSVACTECGGARLARSGREARIGDATLPALLAAPVRDLPAHLDALPASDVLTALRPSLDARLERMAALGLGHLSLDRTAPTLSGGEAQRLQLASQLATDLGGMLVALDEPTLGLWPGSQAGLGAVLDELVAAGNTLVCVEHDPEMVRHAEHLVTVGPGAGEGGGRIVFDGVPPERPLGSAPPLQPTAPPPPDSEPLALRGATLNGLREATLEAWPGRLHVVLGPSGAGKSSLVFGTLLPALRGEPGGPFTELTGAPPGAAAAVDARPIGRTPRSTPATWTGLFDLVRKRFAATDEARALKLGAGVFSFNGKSKRDGYGRCPACEGLGFMRVGLHLSDDLELECGACRGARFTEATLGVRVRGRSIADVLSMCASEAAAFFSEAGGDDLEGRCRALCAALVELGLDYLPLGQPSNRLSRGEAQRVKLAALLGSTRAKPTVVLLDEPDRGLHPTDVERLVAALSRLAQAGHVVVAISHHRHVWAAADDRTLVVDGSAQANPAPSELPAVAPIERRAPDASARQRIELRGVRTNGLRGIDVDLPHGRLVAVCGVSGSGKSSLVFDTLASEAWHRYAETLPFQVRRYARRQPRPPLEAARGLTPVIALRDSDAPAGARSTVATLAGVGPTLRLLWSRAGILDGAPCELAAEAFSPDRAAGACPACAGRGEVRRADPARLVTDPERALGDGALGGTRVGRYLEEPDGRFLAILRAALSEADLTRPWQHLDATSRRVALEGTGDTSFAVRWQMSASAREASDVHEFESTWPGLLALAEEEARRRSGSKAADDWAAPLVPGPCAECEGSGLASAPARVEVEGTSLPELLALPVSEARERLADLDSVVAGALVPDVLARLDDLEALGLGHLHLGRQSATLSSGERTRVRLAASLRSGLTRATFVLDEPTRGLDRASVERLVERLRALTDHGNTVVVVEHEPALLRAADHLIEVGPGSGPEGGLVVAAGTPDEVLAGDGPTARALRATPPRTPEPASASAPPVVVRGARANNLRGFDLELPGRGLACITGVSGSGKSSLVFGVLAASARDGAARGCDDVQGLGRFGAVHSSRADERRRTPLSTLELAKPVARIFANASEGAHKAGAFSWSSAAGRCPVCKGSGRELVALDFLADLALPCPACEGARFKPSVLAVRVADLSIAEFLAQPAGRMPQLLDALPESKDVAQLRAAARALVELGLAHVSLGRAPATLSAGEAQRVGLAAALTQRRRPQDPPALHLFDEPASGLHEADVARLVDALRRLTARGDLVVATEHRSSFVDAADCVVRLGPGAGRAGGRLVGP